MTDRENKREDKIQKFEYLENEENFLDEIKNIFHSFWRASFWIANTSFNKLKDVKMFKFAFKKSKA